MSVYKPIRWYGWLRIMFLPTWISYLEDGWIEYSYYQKGKRHVIGHYREQSDD